MSTDLIDFFKRYLLYCLKNDDLLSEVNFDISEQFSYNLDENFPKITVQLLDDSESTEYSSFEAENVSSYGVQFNVFTENMYINNIVYNAQQSCKIVTDKIKSFMNNLKFKQLNKNIVKLIRVGRDYSIPYDTNSGQVYVTILRYDCETLSTYIKELENYIKEN